MVVHVGNDSNKGKSNLTTGTKGNTTIDTVSNTGRLSETHISTAGKAGQSLIGNIITAGDNAKTVADILLLI